MRFNSVVELSEGKKFHYMRSRALHTGNLSNSITWSNTYVEVFTIEDNTDVIQ